ncbi:histidine phosphatase family protein [uncultured Acinetobacter sp.]|uniref:histidine phosphatase family protein n=1 Tax=uncultured Acinetobacter sp. TaxID=165433 RepID=UPI002612F68D|nr:histidine phosphatase family protein [uncultured Acinetobacter sp.]
MTKIYLVRHGQASFGAANYDQLSERGQMQAKVLGQYFKRVIQQQPYVVAGALQRHQQTAQLALAASFAQADIHTSTLWNEFDHQHVLAQYDSRLAELQWLQQQLKQVKQPRDYLAQLFYPAMQRWSEGNPEHQYQETWLDFQQRVKQGLEALCHEITMHAPPVVVVFTSGGVISVAAAQVLGLSAQQTFAVNWQITNASFTTLTYVDGQLNLCSLNEHHYLLEQQPDLLTWL